MRSNVSSICTSSPSSQPASTYGSDTAVQKLNEQPVIFDGTSCARSANCVWAGRSSLPSLHWPTSFGASVPQSDRLRYGSVRNTS